MGCNLLDMAQLEDTMAMTPEEFKEKMTEICNGNNCEEDHKKADALMCAILTELGYGDGASVFSQLHWWYA